MSISALSHSSLQGALRAMERMDRSAANIASTALSNNADVGSLTSELAGLKGQELEVRANLSMLRTADKLLGSIIDVRA